MSRARSYVLGLGACVVLAGGCVRTTNKDGAGGCIDSNDCASGNECISGMCQATGSGGSASGGTSSDGGSSAVTGGAVGNTGGSPSSGGTAGSGDTGGSSSGGSSEGGSSTGGGSAETGGSKSTGGSGGATATGGGAATPDLIDDLEDGDGRILANSGRQGPWHEFNSSDTGAGRPVQPQAGGAKSSQFAMHTTGTGFTFAGLGFGLNNADSAPESAQSKAYDASAWTGIAFMIKAGSLGSANLRVEAPMRDFVPTGRGGTCNDPCWNVYGFAPTAQLTTSWQEVKVPFSSMQREMGGSTPAFDAKQLMGISFKHTGNDDRFDFWIDDVRFYKD